MAYNKFLEYKWRKAFRFLDIDKDGYLTEEDFAIIAADISEKTGASDKEKAKTREEHVKWMKYLQPDPSVKKISEEMMFRCCAEMYKDIDNFKSLEEAYYSDLFDNLDLNKDGQISFEELNIYYEGCGVKDGRFIRRVFDQLDANKDEYIDRDELIKAGVQYWTSSDERDGYSIMHDDQRSEDKTIRKT